MLSLSNNVDILFDFQKSENINSWRIVDDGVMGGLSQGIFTMNEKGHGEFKGTVSLENNGGFSSVRYRFSRQDATPYEKFVIRVKGDGKEYQFRVKNDSYDRQSYITYFQTNGEWQELELSFDDMYPSFRGYKLRMPNFPGEKMEEIAFLIGNKKAEQFKLEIDWIKLK